MNTKFIAFITIGVVVLASSTVLSTMTIESGTSTFLHTLNNCNDNPIANFTYLPLHPLVGESVIFNASQSVDKDGYIVLYSWSYITEGEFHFPIHMGYGMILVYLWDKPGVYNVTLAVTDNEDNMDTTSSLVSVAVNDPPEMPIKPSGPDSGRRGRKFTYSTLTTDLNGDHVKYGWNWTGGDDVEDLTVDEWTDFCESGVIVETSHIWFKKGNYEIRVLAADEHNAVSEWSDPLTVTIFKNKNLAMSESLIRIIHKWFFDLDFTRPVLT